MHYCNCITFKYVCYRAGLGNGRYKNIEQMNKWNQKCNKEHNVCKTGVYQFVSCKTITKQKETVQNQKL